MKTSPKIKKAASGKPAGKEKTVKTGKSAASAAGKAKPRNAADKKKATGNAKPGADQSVAPSRKAKATKPGKKLIADQIAVPSRKAGAAKASKKLITDQSTAPAHKAKKAKPGKKLAASQRNAPSRKAKATKPTSPAAKTPTQPKAPNFLDTVYQIARRIPRGRATSYGAIAESAGIRLSARMVGWAMNAAGRANPPVPAHRVVNSKGLLTGKHHFATPTLMQELLENEGITVKDDQIQNFNTVFWDPQEQHGKGKAKKKK